MQHLRAQEVDVPGHLLAHVAPLGWKHIALTGDYVWMVLKSQDIYRPCVIFDSCSKPRRRTILNKSCGDPTFLQSLAPVTAQGFVARNARAEKQAYDAIGMTDTLSDQHLAFTADVATVFLLMGLYLDHRSDARFAALIGQECANECPAIDLVRLRMSTPA